MQLRQLEYLVILARERHFGRAAQCCEISQSALSQALRNIEQEFGVPIVDRRNQGFRGFTPEGMRIIVFDRAQRPVFESDSAAFTPYGGWVFSTLAWELSRYTNAFRIVLEGHTEQGLAPENEQHTGWELSTDRAHSARRKLLENQVAPSLIRKVAGYADTLPLPDISPEDESNRRVSVLLKLKSGDNP